jgi:DNA-binding response OmpR family regulator
MISYSSVFARRLSFRFSAADSDSSGPESEAPSFAGAVPEKSHARILYVEDNEDLLFLMAERLQMEGYSIAEAMTKSAAEKTLASEIFDLVILDLMLPDGDGLDLLSMIRGDARLRAVPVLILSGRSDDGTMTEGYRRGADGYLVKTARFDEIVRAIRAALAQPRGTS